MYDPTNWLDHVTSPSNVFTIVDNGNGTYTITPAGTIMQQGTPQDQTHFNKMEWGILDSHIAAALILNALRQLTWKNENELADVQSDIGDLKAEDITLDGKIDALATNTDLAVSDIHIAARLILNLARQNRWHIDKIQSWITEHQIVQSGTVSLTNTLAFPFNNSKTTVSLSPVRENTNYIVLTEITAAVGNVGEVEISDKATNGFAIAYTGSASSATIRYIVLGGYQE